MTTYNISINDELAEVLERVMHERRYSNRSEFFRDLIRRFYLDEIGIVEELEENDPDAKLLQSRKKNAKFVPLKNLLK